MKFIKNMFTKGKALLLTGALALGAAAPAHAQIDLTAVTDEVSATSVALIAAGALVVGAGLAVAAIRFGGLWSWRTFKSFTK